MSEVSDCVFCGGEAEYRKCTRNPKSDWQLMCTSCWLRSPSSPDRLTAEVYWDEVMFNLAEGACVTRTGTPMRPERYGAHVKGAGKLKSRTM